MCLPWSNRYLNLKAYFIKRQGWEFSPSLFFAQNCFIVVAEASINTQMNVLSNFWKNFHNYFENNHTNVSLIWGFCLFVLIGCLDYQVSPNISLSVFYLLPISLTTWFVSKKAGLITGGVSAIAGFITKFDSDYTTDSILVTSWNATVMLMVFFTVSSLLFKLRDALKQEQELARTDGTTGVANKRLFFELAGLEVKKAHRYRHPLTIIYLDIDDFKTINKNLGRQMVDKLLHTAAQSLVNNLRETDIIGRIGEDEFAILLPGSGYEPSHTVIYRVQTQLIEAMEENEWGVTFGISAVTLIHPPNSVDEMLQKADHLMYLVKNNGKNQVKHKTSI